MKNIQDEGNIILLYLYNKTKGNPSGYYNFVNWDNNIGIGTLCHFLVNKGYTEYKMGNYSLSLTAYGIEYIENNLPSIENIVENIINNRNNDELIEYKILSILYLNYMMMSKKCENITKFNILKYFDYISRYDMEIEEIYKYWNYRYDFDNPFEMNNLIEKLLSKNLIEKNDKNYLCITQIGINKLQKILNVDNKKEEENIENNLIAILKIENMNTININSNNDNNTNYNNNRDIIIDKPKEKKNLILKFIGYILKLININV